MVELPIQYRKASISVIISMSPQCNAMARGALTLKLSVPGGRVDMFAIVAVLVVNWLLVLVDAN